MDEEQRHFDPRIIRSGPTEPVEFTELIYWVVFWSPTGPKPDAAWLSDAYYLHDVDAADAMQWGFANRKDDEILEVMALGVIPDEVTCFVLYGYRPTKDPARCTYPPPADISRPLPTREQAEEAWRDPVRRTNSAY